MSKIPIFDSLAHPTIDTTWISSDFPGIASKELLLKQMEESYTSWAFVVGMKGIGGYSEKEYVVEMKGNENKELLPIAFFDPASKNYSTIKEELQSIKELGYTGIKLHPRISEFTINEQIATIIKSANDLRLVCMLCTYSYSSSIARKINPEIIMDMLSLTNDAKLILLHAGAVRLMEYMELARAFKNVLLDLSFTICKYKGSSLDLDIQYMFNNFDRRICIGSDFPQYSLGDLRNRFDFFSKNLEPEKASNIANKNLISFIQP